MGVTGKNQSDFFVYTHFRIHQERITLNPEIWKNILQTLQQFWYKYLAPEVLLKKLQNPLESIALHDQAQAQPKFKHRTNCIYLHGKLYISRKSLL